MRIGMMRVGNDAIIDEPQWQQIRTTVKNTNNKEASMSYVARVGDEQLHIFNPPFSRPNTRLLISSDN